MRTIQSTKLAQRAAHACSVGDYEAAADWFQLARLTAPRKPDRRSQSKADRVVQLTVKEVHRG